MYSGKNLWNNLPLRIKILTEDKAFQQNLMRKLTTKLIKEVWTISQQKLIKEVWSISFIFNMIVLRLCSQYL